MIQLDNVTIRYGNDVALADVSLQVEAGKTTVLIGPSGCGKSTALRLIIGLIKPDSGEIRFDGQALSAETLPIIRQHIGYVIQEGGLFPHLTARQNCGLMPHQLGWTDADTDRRLKKLAALVHLPIEMMDRFPLELSGGQQQRVALMRALMLDPDVLLLDEPLGALDPMIRAELQTELRDIFQRLGKTVVMVTHDMHEAAFFADIVVLMNDGLIVQSGDVDSLLNRPANDFVTTFIRAQRSVLPNMPEGER